MRLEIDEQVLGNAIADRLTAAILQSPDFIERIVDGILLRFEILTPAETAAIIDVTTRTLGENHVKWGLDKSVALGDQLPKYFLSQVIERLKAKAIKGRKPEELKAA